MFRSLVHTLVLVGVVSIAFVGAPACGGGGGGGGAPQAIPVNFVGTYDFSIGEVPGSPSLLVLFDYGLAAYGIEIQPGKFGVNGTFDTTTRAWTIDSSSSFDIDTDAGPDALFGAFNLGVDTPIVVPFDGPPEEGAVTVTNGIFTAMVEFVPGGVNFSLPLVLPVFYTWEDFEALVEAGGSTDAERVAAYSVQILRFLLERYDQVVDTLFFIAAQFDNFENGFNPINLPAATWPVGYSLVPPTIANPGLGTLLWDDSNNFDDEISMGDDFSWNAYELRPTAQSERMYDGGVSLENLVALIGPGNDVLGFGFRANPLGGGGVMFNDLIIYEMNVDDGAMTVVRGQSATVNGAFAIEFWKP